MRFVGPGATTQCALRTAGRTRFVVTTNGPELVDELSGPPDREHYVEKQVMPVAVAVLDALGLDFAQVIGDDRQQELF